jgi:hypothetical protein
MEIYRIPKRVLYMNLESTRPRGRQRNRRQDERIVGGEEWQERVNNTEEWKELENEKEWSHSAHATME